ncbi:hypothetical protein SBADM41S_04119 [Streptomyces badius]
MPHFHFAGFAAALIRRGVPGLRRPGGPFAAPCVPLGTLVVLVGYFIGDWAELAGARRLTAGMWTVGLLTWRLGQAEGAGPDDAAPAALRRRRPGAAMLLALELGARRGDRAPPPHPDLDGRHHGLGNALGFALCSLLAWRRIHLHDAARTEARTAVHTHTEGRTA